MCRCSARCSAAATAPSCARRQGPAKRHAPSWQSCTCSPMWSPSARKQKATTTSWCATLSLRLNISNAQEALHALIVESLLVCVASLPSGSGKLACTKLAMLHVLSHVRTAIARTLTATPAVVRLIFVPLCRLLQRFACMHRPVTSAVYVALYKLGALNTSAGVSASMVLLQCERQLQCRVR